MSSLADLVEVAARRDLELGVPDQGRIAPGGQALGQARDLRGISDEALGGVRLRVPFSMSFRLLAGTIVLVLDDDRLGVLTPIVVK